MKRILFSLMCISLLLTGCKDKNTQLIQAAGDGNLPAVQSLLADGADINFKDAANGATALARIFHTSYYEASFGSILTGR